VLELLSKEDNRRLAQLERHLMRDDPEFCARMQPGRPLRRRVPISLVVTAAVIWAAALVFGVLGWWVPAGIAAGCAIVIAVTVAIRCRPGRRPAPPSW
jgi:Protein of unknown function (DUF3040)